MASRHLHAYRMAYSGRIGIEPGSSYSGHKLRLPQSQIDRLERFNAPGRTKELYNNHSLFDRARLKEFLKRRQAPFLLSMPDIPAIRRDYSRWTRISKACWFASMKRASGVKREPMRELLIANY